MEKKELAVVGLVVFLLIGAFVWRAQRSKQGGTPQTGQTNIMQSTTPTPASATTETPAPTEAQQKRPSGVADTSLSKPTLWGFVLGSSPRAVATTVASKGFPNPGCNDGPDGFEDCTTRRGMPGDSNHEVFMLKFFKGALYEVDYVFPPESYPSVFSALTVQYGNPNFPDKKGVGWKFGTLPEDPTAPKYLVLLHPKGDTSRWGVFPKAAMLDVGVFSDRLIADTYQNSQK